eukprot:scaffold115045_cov21-Phaeocystis_antarctica.AAC.1
MPLNSPSDAGSKDADSPPLSGVSRASMAACAAASSSTRSPPDAPAAVRGVRIASCEGMVVRRKK